MLLDRSCRVLLGAWLLLTVTALSLAEVQEVQKESESPVHLEGTVESGPRTDRRYERRENFLSSVRRYNLQDLTEVRHRPAINTHLFPQLAINHDLDWLNQQPPPHNNHEPDHHEPEPEPRPPKPHFPEPSYHYPPPNHKEPEDHHNHHYHPEPSHHPKPHRPNHEHHPKPHRPPHRITKTLTKTITSGPTVFWTEFVPYCSMEPLPGSCSVANKDVTVTTTDTSRVVYVTERTYTYEDAYCLDVESQYVTETSTIDVTTTTDPVITITASSGNSLTNTRTKITPTTVVATESTETTVYESSYITSDCYEYVQTTTVPFPGQTTRITITRSQSDTDTWTYNDLASCTTASTETIVQEPTHTLTVVGYELSTVKVTKTLTTDLACSDSLYIVTETLPETVTNVIFEATFYTEISYTTGDPTFTCPDTVTVTSTAQPQSTTTSREPLTTFTQTYTDTVFELEAYYWCSGVRTTSTEVHTVKETSTRTVTIGATSTRLVPNSECIQGNPLPHHGCPEEFLMAVKTIMIEMTEIFIELRYALFELIPHVGDHERRAIERFNSLPLQEILGNLPLNEQREEALWSQQQLKELRELVMVGKSKGVVPVGLFDKINLVVSRMERIKRALDKRT